MRRAAAKCLDAIIGSWHEMLPDFYKNISSALIARFKGIFFKFPFLIILVIRFVTFYKNLLLGPNINSGRIS